MGHRNIRAPRGTELSCRSWPQEAALRMLMNNLDPEVAERPEDLVVYGGTGKAARNWEAYDAIVRALRDAGRRRDAAGPVGQAGRVVPHARPRAAGADRQLDAGPEVGRLGDVPRAGGAGPHHVRADDRGLVDLHRHAGHPAGHLRDASPSARTSTSAVRSPARSMLTGGLGGMGGAQPLAVDDERGRGARASKSTRARIERRIETRYLDRMTADLDEAMALVDAGAGGAARPSRSGWSATPPRCFPSCLRRGFMPDMVTDQTVGARPAQRLRARAACRSTKRRAAASRPGGYVRRSYESMAAQVEAMVDFAGRAPSSSTTATTCGPGAEEGGLAHERVRFPGFVPAFIRPLFCEGKGPFRWAALRGDPADIAATDRAVPKLFPDDEPPAPLDPHGRGARRVPGAARADLLARLRRARPRRDAFNELVASGEVSAPIVIGRDHLDAGSVASPNRETEAMLDGSDAIADWPILNALDQHRRGRALGERASRGRRRDRVLDPRGHGGGGRRHRERR